MKRIVWLLLSGAMGWAGACSSTSGAPVDASVEEAAVMNSPCPAKQPAQGSACNGGSACSYGQDCDQTVSVCTGGFWENSPAVVTAGGQCPADVPASGASCTLCPSNGPCTYDCLGDAATSAQASCTGGKWSLTTQPCVHDAGSDAAEVGPDAPDGAPPDAADAAHDASDAQGDAPG